MKIEQTAFYSTYLTQVLGVKNFIRPHGEALPEPESVEKSWRTLNSNESVDLKELVDCVKQKKFVLLSLLRNKSEASIFDPESFAMLSKMQQALALQGDEGVIIECVGFPISEIFHTFLDWTEKKVVLFSDTPERRGVQSVSHVHWVETYSPQFLLGHIQNKKQTWDDLQSLFNAKTWTTQV